MATIDVAFKTVFAERLRCSCHLHSSASRASRSLPNGNAILVHSTYAMQWDVMNDSVFVVEGKGVWSLRVETD